MLTQNHGHKSDTDDTPGEGLDLIGNFKRFISELDPDNMHNLHEVFDQDVVFIDPFHRVRGLENLTTYYSQMYENLNSIEFEFADDTITANQASIAWRMTFSHKSLARGREISVDGMSALVFQGGKVIYHRDYFDAGALLYEHIPVLGWMVSQIKRRIQNS